MKLLAFFIIVVNPMNMGTPAIGPHNDWEPLKTEYAACAHNWQGYFNYVACAVGAHERAVHPITKI